MKKMLLICQTEVKESVGDIVDILLAQEYECSAKTVSQLKNADYDNYDLLVGMERADLRDMYRICGGDFAGKMFLLAEFTDHKGKC